MTSTMYCSNAPSFSADEHKGIKKHVSVFRFTTCYVTHNSKQVIKAWINNHEPLVYLGHHRTTNWSYPQSHRHSCTATPPS